MQNNIEKEEGRKKENVWKTIKSQAKEKYQKKIVKQANF